MLASSPFQEGNGSALDGASRPAMVRLLDVVPDMLDVIPVEEQELAGRTALAPVTTLGPGEIVVPRFAAQPVASIILEGFILRRTAVGERWMAEILGPGDVIDTRPDDEPRSAGGQTEYVAHGRAIVAELDDRFRLVARRWPALHEVVIHRLSEQVQRMSRHLAVLALPRVDDRLEALFHELADRCGRMTPEGILIELPITHGVLGELVGSRRPTVSLALAELAAAGRVVRHTDKRWLIAPEADAAELLPTSG